MVHINIDIQKYEPSILVRPGLRPLIATLLIGVLIGVFSTGNFAVPTPGDIGGQLGAVGNLADTRVDEEVTPPPPVLDASANGVSTEENTENSETPAEELPPDLPTPEEARRLLNSVINEKTLASERIAAEMLRIKNESVELVSGFNQNCANWNDPCATPYKEALDKNNATYDRLVGALANFTQELSDARATLDEIP